MASLNQPCMHCGTNIKPKPKNAVIHAWHDQPWYSRLVLACPFCDLITTIYTGGEAYILAKLERRGIKTIVLGQFAPKKVAKDYRKLVGKPPLVTRRLDQSQELLVEQARLQLTRGKAEAFLKKQLRQNRQ
jgi:hypothetical protein